jgi:hypothetical protein
MTNYPTLRHNGYTYTVYVRIKKRKGKTKVIPEIIKYVTGFRNLWERVGVEEYNKIKELKTK